MVAVVALAWKVEAMAPAARVRLSDLYGDPAAIWGEWCEHPVQRAVIDSGHHMAEEAPTDLADTLERFLGR